MAEGITGISKEGGEQSPLTKGGVMGAIENLKSVVWGVLGVLATTFAVSCFTLYTDFQLMKSDLQQQKEELMEQKELDARFEQLLIKFDKALAVQIETVGHLKEAIIKLDTRGNK